MLVDIGDSDWLYRRLHAGCFKKDGSLSSVAFKINGFPDSEISVDLARLTTPSESVNRAGRSGFRLGSLQAIGPRELEFDVVHDPLQDNTSHSLIRGQNSSARCRQLAKLVTVLEGIVSSDP